MSLRPNRGFMMEDGPTRPGKRITSEMIVKGTKTLATKNEPQERFLQRVTHVKLCERNIAKIEGFNACRNLRVLYLYDNRIERIEGLESCSHLTHLYLQNNEISVIPDLSHLRELSKLYLEGNRISRLEGLDGCQRLEELHFSNQRMPAGGAVTLDDRCLSNLGRSLSVLAMAGNGISDPSDFAHLQALRVLNLDNNAIGDFETMLPVLQNCQMIMKLNLSGNSVTQLSKYRETTIMMSDSLQELDSKPVTMKERQFLLSLERQKAKRRMFAAQSFGVDQEAGM